MEDLCEKKRVKLIVIIVDKGRGNKAIKLLNTYAMTCQFATLGKGTATDGIASFFGFSDTAKDIVFTVIPEEKSPEIMYDIKETLQLHKPNTGLAFTIPIKCVANLWALQYMLGEIKE